MPASDPSAANYEVKFMTDMIDHHMMAIMTAQVCIEEAVHEELRTMCQEIIAAQTKEIQQMQTGQNVFAVLLFQDIAVIPMLTILALTLGAMVMVEPRLAGGAGFWLSASASLALCSVMRIDHQPTLSAFIRRSALSVLAANIATLPIIVIVFHTWSPLSPLANLLIGPLLTITFPVTYVLALIATVSTGTGAWVAWIPGIGLDATLVIVRRIAEVAPLVYLDVEPLAATAIVGVPSALIVAGMSHDGERWLRVVERRWRRDRASLVATLAGAGLGAMVALVIATVV